MTVCLSTDMSDKLVEADFSVAIEHNKRMISASPGAVLLNHWKTGLHRLHLSHEDWCGGQCCLSVASAVPVSALLAWRCRCRHTHNIVEIIAYVCGTTCLPGLDDCICLSDGSREEIETPFSHGTVVEGSMVIQQRFLLLDVLSRLQLSYLSAIEVELREAFSRETKMIEDDWSESYY